MNPANTGSLVVIRPDVCVLANNHVLDFSTIGLADTLHHLGRGRGRGRLAAVGAGRDRTAARRPLAVPVRQGRVLVVAAATTCSWVPASWAASDDQPGVALLPDLAPSTTVELAETLRARQMRLARAGDEGSRWLREILATSGGGYTLQTGNRGLAVTPSGRR